LLFEAFFVLCCQLLLGDFLSVVSIRKAGAKAGFY